MYLVYTGPFCVVWNNLFGKKLLVKEIIGVKNGIPLVELTNVS